MDASLTAPTTFDTALATPNPNPVLGPNTPAVTSTSYLDASTPAVSSTASPTTKPAPAVITAAPAQNSISKAQSLLTDQTTALKNQSATNAQVKIAADKAAADKAAADQTNKLLTAANGAVYDDQGRLKTAAPTGDANYPIINGVQVGTYNEGGRTVYRDIHTGAEVTADGKPLTPTTNPDGTSTTDQLTQLNTDSRNALTSFQNSMNGLKNGTFALTPDQQAQVDALNQQFETLKQQQELANQNYTGGVTQAGVSSGLQRYSPIIAQGKIQAAVTSGIQKIADINSKSALALAQLRQGFADENEKLIMDSYKAFTDYQKQTSDIITHIADKAQEHSEFLANFNQKVEEDKYNQITKPIQDIASSAAQNGASQQIVAAISGAKTVQDAINAAGDALQTASGQLGDYLQYKRDVAKKGLTPEDYASWKTKDDAAQAALKGKEAYSTAYNTAAGKAAAEAAAAEQYGTGDTPIGTGGVVQGGITQATGLSIDAFNYLTQGTAALARMSENSRAKVKKEVNDYLNKTGTDISTFQSQFKAINDVIQKNIERQNQTKIMAGEVSGSADALKDVIDESDLGKFKAGNILKLMAGEQVNDATTMKYSTQLRLMANDLAGYLSAARGGKPELQDQRDAAEIISRGLDKGSVEAFKESILSNEEKVNGVVQAGVNSAQKQVWSLFDKGDQYQPKEATINPKDAVNNYIKSNPTQAENIAKMYEVPGATDEKILEFTQLLQKQTESNSHF